MNFLSYLSPYSLIIKIVGGIGILVGIYFGWQHFIANPYREQGRKEVQALWNAQNARMAGEHLKDIALAHQSEINKAKSAHLIDENHVKGLENEKYELQKSLDSFRATHRMRSITSANLSKSSLPNSATGVSLNHETCTTQLSDEIGIAYEKLRADVIRIGSEANECAITLSAAQEQLKEDRR